MAIFNISIQVNDSWTEEQIRERLNEILPFSIKVTSCRKRKNILDRKIIKARSELAYLQSSYTNYQTTRNPDEKILGHLANSILAKNRYVVVLESEEEARSSEDKRE